MSEVTIIGIDLAKRVFHLHGARVDGSVVFRKKGFASSVACVLHPTPEMHCCYGSLRHGARLGP